MPGRRHAVVAYLRGAAGLSSTSSSDPDFHSSGDHFFTVRGALVRLIGLGSAGLAVCTLLYFVAPYNRFAETTTHFVTWYASFGAIGFAVSLALRERKTAVLCLAFTLFYLTLIVPWYWPGRNLAAINEPNVRVLTANLLSINEEAELLLDLVESSDPDVIVLQELSPMWIRALAPLRETHKFHVERGRSDHFGIGTYSRIPLENAEVFNLADARYPAIRADIQVNGRLVSVLNMHTVPPLTADLFTIRNEQLEAAAMFADAADDLTIVAGDLNITMWSPYYRKLETDSELRNVRRGFGIIPTWPANLPLFKIALDHVLVSQDIFVIDLERGTDIGSDHLPLIADLFVPARDS